MDTREKAIDFMKKINQAVIAIILVFICVICFLITLVFAYNKLIKPATNSNVDLGGLIYTLDDRFIIKSDENGKTGTAANGIKTVIIYKASKTDRPTENSKTDRPKR